MTILLLLIVTIIGYIWTNHYKGENGRIPPISTKKGKEARLVGIPVILAVFGAIALQLMADSHDRKTLNATLLAMGSGALVAIISAIRRWNDK